MRIRQLSTDRAGRQLRWTQDGSQSLRAYVTPTDDDDCPCVSSRSGELNLVLDGEVVIDVGPAHQIVTVRAGEACLVPRGLPHSVRVLRSGRVLIVDVLGAAAEQGLRVLPAHLLPARVFRGLDRAWRTPVKDALLLSRDGAAGVVERLASRAPLVIEATSATRRMTQAKQILERRFADPPALGELAKELGINEFYLLRSFKKHFRFSPLAYAQFLKTEHFLWELLGAKSQRTLLRLSSDAGFGDYSTFERRIRDMFGRTPSSLVEDDAEGELGPG
jgi:AraC-like DNA-binding protein/mannose-6-phosphate isomerase-like protein (cupin superfamily)